jgi:DNA-binding NarL/FixJ family response regulator
MIQIAMADDHVLFRKGLAALIESFGIYKVIIQAANGQELMNSLAENPTLPDLILLDVSMPVMDGYQTAKNIHSKYPNAKMLALSMLDSEETIMRMIRNGVKGYVLKDAEPAELKKALSDLYATGYYYSELVSGRLMHKMQSDTESVENPIEKLSPKETEFLSMVCTELTYKEIAERMYVSPRTVDGYRDILFDKLGVKTRVGLCMFAIKNGLTTI